VDQPPRRSGPGNAPGGGCDLSGGGSRTRRDHGRRRGKLRLRRGGAGADRARRTGDPPGARPGREQARSHARNRPPIGTPRARDLRAGGGSPRTGNGKRETENMTGPIVRVAGLTKVFRSYRREEGLAAALKSLVRRVQTEIAAVSDVTFSVEPGEMVGYIGANGAGKSTTIKMLTGILTPTSGEIVCNGFVP